MASIFQKREMVTFYYKVLEIVKNLKKFFKATFKKLLGVKCLIILMLQNSAHVCKSYDSMPDLLIPLIIIFLI